MSRMRDDFDTAVRQAMKIRHAVDQQLEEWGRRADENPVEVAATLFRSTLYWRRVWRRRYRRLAAKAKKRIVGEAEHAWLVSLEIGEPLETGELLYALWQHNLWEATFWLMLELAEMAVAEEEDLHQATIGAFMFAQRRAYEALAGSTHPEWLPPQMRERVAARLAGEVGAQVSLSHNKRLRSVLSEEGGSAGDLLLQELPAAVMQEWAMPPSGVSVSTSGKHLVWATPLSGYSPLLRRVARLLESGGSEQGRLERAGKLADEPPDMAGTEDEDLAEFERQETLRQDLTRLRGWVQGAGFSVNEARVYELDMETNFDTKAISQKLEKSPSTVRQYRKRYLDKVRKAAGL